MYGASDAVPVYGAADDPALAALAGRLVMMILMILMMMMMIFAASLESLETTTPSMLRSLRPPLHAMDRSMEVSPSQSV